MLEHLYSTSAAPVTWQWIQLTSEEEVVVVLVRRGGA